MDEKTRVKRALISVSDKTGVEELATQLAGLGIELISTGGTLKRIKEAGIQVVSCSTFTGSPEVLGGRVKTLHPKIHSGILYRREDPADEEQLVQLDSKPIDLVVVNLYPFKETLAKADATDEDKIENIDIGGPTLIRAAAKNFQSVTVVVDPSDYDELIRQMKDNDGGTTLQFRKMCAGKAYALTSSYDTAIAGYFAGHDGAGDPDFPPQWRRTYRFASDLRYGENPHQKAALYSDDSYPGPTLLKAQILSGKELSYNNYGDLNACLSMLVDSAEPFACVLKHANPCGAAIGKNPAEAYKRAYESDPLSAYGSIIGLNREVDLECARLLHDTFFVECILAPGFTEEAFGLLRKKKARRLLALPGIVEGRLRGETTPAYIAGGMLLQTADDKITAAKDLKVVTERKPTDEEVRQMLFAWMVVKHTKSNAIVLAKDDATVGIGMGQTSRVDAAALAVKRAGDRAKGAVMASDAFFPMPDGVETGTNAGVTAIIQPGGSKGDEKAVEAANKAGAAMVFTGVRHFKH
jgi:phosphoribosylaminoimidazolecarboxamide formyltransferase/IMP cyclohydrolase